LADRIPENLECPDCREPLRVDLEQDSDRGPRVGQDPHCEGGQVVCDGCSRSFPIIEGIPRFVEQQHLASFGLQWNRYEVAHAEEDLATFQAKTGIALSELSGLKVLDAGCGGGRYCRVAAEAGAHVFGADHSAAVEKASRLCAGLNEVKLVQADLKHLPFAEESFDLVLSLIHI